MCLEEEPQKKRTRVWEKAWISRPKEQGAYHHLVQELKLFKDQLRMSHDDFGFLVDKDATYVQREDTHICISASSFDSSHSAILYFSYGQSHEK